MGKIVSVVNSIAKLPDARNLSARFAGSPATEATMVTLPKNLLLSPGTLYENFETLGSWNGSGGTRAANTTQFKTGTQSIKLTTNAGVTANLWRVVNWDLSGNFGGVSFWIYVDNTVVSDLGGNLLQIDLVNDAGFANYMSWSAPGSAATWIPLSGWHRLYVPRSYFHQVGAGTFANPITRIVFTVPSAPGKNVAISFDDFEVGETRLPAILMRFDDGFAVQHSIAYTHMRQYGLPGTCYFITGYLGSGGFLTLSQLLEIDAGGWAIANHTRSHTYLGGLSVADQQTAIADGRADLVAWGLSRCADYLAYPGGTFDSNTLTALSNLGTKIGNATIPTISETDASTGGYVPQVLPDDLSGDNFHVRFVSHNSTTSLAVAKTILDVSIAGGVILSPLFHRIDSGGEFTEANFRAYVDYVVTKWKAGLIFPITIDDYYKLTLGPVEVPVASER